MFARVFPKGVNTRLPVCACNGDMFMRSSSCVDLSVELEKAIDTGWGAVILIPTSRRDQVGHLKQAGFGYPLFNFNFEIMNEL